MNVPTLGLRNSVLIWDTYRVSRLRFSARYEIFRADG